MKKQMVFLISSIVFALVFLFSILIIVRSSQPSAVPVFKSADEATAVFISPETNYYLKGEMEMYPGVFLMPSSIDSSDVAPIKISNLSEIRNSACITEQSYTSTIRFYIKTSSDKYAMVLPGTFCEYLVFINGETVASSSTLRSSSPSYPSPAVIVFPETESDMYEVVLVTITPTNSKASTSSTILFGVKERIEKIAAISFTAEIIFFAIIFVTIIFALIQYIAIKREKLISSFILLSIAVLINLSFSGDVIIMNFFPGMNYLLGTALKGIALPLLVLAVIYHSYCMFPSLFSNRLLDIVCGLLLIPFLNYILPKKILILQIPAIITYVLAFTICYQAVLKAHARKYINSLLFSIGLISFSLFEVVELITAMFPVGIHFTHFYPFVVFTIIEIFILARSYNDQANAEQFYTEELTKTLETMQDSENAFLNAQMKPHFLYNTFNTIADLCVVDPDKAKKLISTLEDYLKLILSIDNMDKTVPLSQEMELATSYTQIEKERFPSINFYTDFPVVMPTVNMPPLTLQPLIENAIKHGVRKSDRPGAITLRIRETETGVTFYVSDNGVGMDEATMKKLFEQPKENKSIGVYNIDKRLKNIYNSHLEVDSTIGYGTCVSFTIPK